MGITRLSIHRPVTIVMVMLALVIMGLVAMALLPVSLYPNLSLPVAAVHTSWPGASPTQVEQQVTDPIEQILQELPGVAQIMSTSEAGQSTVIVEFAFGQNLSDEVNQMRSLVNRIQPELPSTAKVPEVEQFNPSNLPIMTVVVYGNAALGDITAVAQNLVQPPIEEASGVGQVTLTGGLSEQVEVDVSPTRLAFYHLNINDVTNALAAANIAGNVGQLNRASQQIPLYLTGQVETPSQLEAIPVVGGPQGLTLGDVATVREDYATPTELAQFNGHPAVSMTVVQASGSNTVDVANAVQQALARVKRTLPPGIHATVINDQASIVSETLHTVVVHTLLGFIIGVLVILGILRSIRTTVVVAVAIPIAMLSTFILLYLAGLNLDTTTLGALAVGLGSLVDFSVVVLESIFRARQRGLEPKEAALKGAQEVGLAVTVAALAQVCVFLPAVFTPGIAGQFFGPIGLTFSFAHLAALFVAVTMTPMLASRLLKGRRFEGPETVPGRDAPFRAWAPFDWFGLGMAVVTDTYRRLLKWGLRHRAIIIGGSALMLVVSLVLVPLIGFELVAPVGSGQLSIAATLPPGTSLATAQKTANRLVLLAKQHLPGVETIYAQEGGGGPQNPNGASSVAVDVTLKATSFKQLAQLAFRLRPYFAAFPGDQIAVVPGSAVRGVQAGQVSVSILGPDLNTLTILSDKVAALMARTPGLAYVDNTLTTGTPEYTFTLNPAALTAYGLTAGQVMQTLNTALGGTQAGTFYQGEEAYPIEVNFPQSYAENIQNLQSLTVVNNQGQAVPLLQLGQLSLTTTPPVINHVNGTRSVSVSADVIGTSQGQAQRELTAELHHIPVPAGYQITFGAPRALSLGATFRDLGIALALSIVLVYMVMASLFESILTPFVILFSVPTSFVGAAWGLYLTHNTLNVDSLIGVVMLVGLVTNNAIVLVDYTNQLRAQGRSLLEALEIAGPVRLRPILMTTATTVLAMLPLALGIGTGASALAGMAVVISFGLSLSMLVSLLLVPVMYITLDRKERRAMRQARVAQQAPAPPAASPSPSLPG